MRTVIPSGKWQPHTAVSPSLGPTSVVKPLGWWAENTRVSKTPYRRGEGKAVYQAPPSHNTGVGWEPHSNSTTTCALQHWNSFNTWPNRLSVNVRKTNLIIFQFSPRQNKLNQSKTIQLQQNYITFDQTRSTNFYILLTSSLNGENTQFYLFENLFKAFSQWHTASYNI